jgi:malonate-semialdehyde dehydrogenase (acetylating)/methylmalonate-semialdehyde dehydrogenase
MRDPVTHFVGGKPWVHGAARQGRLYDPTTGENNAMVDFASAADVAAIVDVAATAAASWKDASLSKRTTIMFAFRQLLHERRDELAAVVSAEHGKVHSDALGEVQRALEVVEYACGIPSALKGGFSENVSTEVDSYSIRQPLGVVAVISPFNFPAMVPLWFVPVAIACGNTVVLKPSEKDPSA